MYNFFFMNQKPIFCYVDYKSITLLQFAEFVRITIPRFCFHEKLTIAGNCRMCLVEIKGAIKPIISCGTNVATYIDVFTDTFFVKKARENVLEFLLINHPLDCPICDQAGECDLQDQSLMYGSDRGRFKEMKRSVDDKDFGPVIKTIMTRCIHCTRCVRFSDEIAGINSLGCVGRGSDMEIKMVLENFFDSEISGNIVDLCPVGALTSRPYAFSGRPWDLQNMNTIDVLDSLHSNIRVDVKGNKIFRVLPIQNEHVNEEWISDLIRFSYESLQFYRLDFPYVKFDSFVHFFFFLSYRAVLNVRTRVSWEFLWELKSFFFPKNMSYFDMSHFFLGNEVGLVTSYFFFLISQHTINYFSHFFLENDRSKSIDFRDSFFFSNSVDQVLKNKFHILHNLDLKSSLPVLNARIKRYMSNTLDTKYFMYVGPSVQFTYDVYRIGFSLWYLYKMIRGSLLACNIFTKSGFSQMKRTLSFTGDCTGENFVNVLKKSNAFTEVVENHCVPFSNISGSYEIGLKSSEISLLKMLDWSYLNHFLFFLKTNNDTIPYWAKNKSSFSIFQGICLSQQFDLEIKNYTFLPASNFFEHEELYINMFGLLQQSNQVVDLIEDQEVYSDFFLLQEFFFFLIRLNSFIHRIENSMKDFFDNYIFYFYSIDNGRGRYITDMYHDLVFLYLNYFCLVFDSIPNVTNHNFRSNICFNGNDEIGISSCFSFRRPRFDMRKFFYVEYSSTLSKIYGRKFRVLNNFYSRNKSFSM